MRKSTLAPTGFNRSAYISTIFRALAAVVVLLTFGLGAADAQTMGNSQDNIDSRLRSSAKVDPATQAMQLQISLGNYPGRNGLSVPINLSYSSKVWQIQYQGTRTFGPPGGQETDTTYLPIYGNGSASGWISNIDGEVFAQTPKLEYYDANGVLLDGRHNSTSGAYGVARIFITLQDGSRHELRRDDNLYLNQLPSFPGSYYAVDGSRLRFDTSTGKLYFPDGTQFYTEYDANGSPISNHYVDRNGNHLISSPHFTDTLGRTINPPLAYRYQQTYTGAGDYTYTVPGVNGTTLTYTLRWRNLSDVLTDPSQPLRYTGDGTVGFPHQPVSPSLFSTFDTTETVVANSSTPFNPVVLYQIVLPNGGAYTFTYNVWGEISKVVYPTGGYEIFAYDIVTAMGGMIQAELFAQGNRGVTAHCVSPSGSGSDLACSQYAINITGSYPNQNFEASVIAPDGTMSTTVSFNNKYNNQPTPDIAFGFDDPLAGRAYEERFYSAPIPGTTTRTLLRRKLTKWVVDGTTQTWGGGKILYKTHNPRVTKEVEILFDTGGNALTKTTEYTYDTDLNLISTSQYDFSSMDATTAQTATIGSIATGARVRTTQMTYLVSDPSISSSVQASYRALNLLGLPTKTTILDGSGATVAQTLYSYDEAAYPLITYGSVVNWTDPGQYRGNVTTLQRLISPSTNTYVTTHAQYDQTGNVCATTDATGNVSQVTYSSTYSYAYPTQTTTAVPDPTGTHGSTVALTTSTIYDLNTGLPTSSTDANGQTTTFVYNDSLDRLTLVTRPTGGGTTAYSYGDTPGNLYIRVQTSLDSTRVIDKYQFFDNAGRPVRSFLNEGGTYITSDIQYDLMGRALRTSNPYRVNSLTDSINPSGLWTTNSYDDLGRVITVTLTDGSQIHTLYSGNLVTVTDQAGMARRSVTDGLGRLTQVIEDPTTTSCQSNGAGCSTSYTYDSLDDLVTVTQGGQTRNFGYDSLKRLTSAANPESGTISYVYDANGNLLVKTDARLVSSHYQYDSLNRLTRHWYNGSYSTGSTVNNSPALPSGVGATAEVNLYYDGTTTSSPPSVGLVNPAAYSIGKMTASGTSDGYVNYFEFDQLGRTVKTVQRVGSIDYPFSYSYNLGGEQTSETYPTSRVINMDYDSAGRVSKIHGPSNSPYYVGSSTSSIQYTPAGALSSETYGNGLVHSISYNPRLQPTDIMLGTISTPGSALALNYTYGTATTNNGNITATAISAGSQVINQTFTYDSLNRLLSAQEGNGTPWQQNFSYDRYGNRAIVTGGGGSGGGTATHGTGTVTIDGSEQSTQVQVQDYCQLYGDEGCLEWHYSWITTYDTGTVSITVNGFTASASYGAGSTPTSIATALTTALNGSSSPVTATLSGTTITLTSTATGAASNYTLSTASNTDDIADFGGPSFYATPSGSTLTGGSDTGGGSSGGGTPDLTFNGNNQIVGFVYDAAGNLLADGHHTYVYDAENRLSSADNGAQSYAYDSNGHRVKKTPTDNLRMVYDAGGRLAAEYDASSLALKKEYIYGVGGLLATIDPTNGTLYITPDHLGTPRLVTNASGNVFDKHDYKPFGEEIFAGTGIRTAGQGYGINDQTSGPPRQKFTAKERDTETGLDYFEARYYSSAQGRFTSADDCRNDTHISDPQSWNLFVYVRNNPLLYIDPTGETINEPTGLSSGDQKKYESWKATYLSTEAGRAEWKKYQDDDQFTLNIEFKDRGSEKNNEGAITTNQKFDENGRFVGATIILGNNLSSGTASTDYPIGTTMNNASGDIKAAEKIAHEFGHVDDDRSLGRLYFLQKSAEAVMDTRFDELKATNATPNQITNDLEIGRMTLEYSALFGASPDQIAQGREIRAERTTIPFLREKWNNIPGETQSAIKKYEKRYGKQN